MAATSSDDSGRIGIGREVHVLSPHPLESHGENARHRRGVSAVEQGRRRGLGDRAEVHFQGVPVRRSDSVAEFVDLEASLVAVGHHIEECSAAGLQSRLVADGEQVRESCPPLLVELQSDVRCGVA
jgi:hypothetical protein